MTARPWRFEVMPLAAEGKSRFSVSVRDLVEFVLRRGNLGGSGLFSGPGRALEGSKAHRRLQNSRPAEYESEVSISYEIEAPDFVLCVQGRIDGLTIKQGRACIEEIKSRIGSLPLEVDTLHQAQAKIYAAMVLSERPQIIEADVHITYVEVESGLEKTFAESYSRIDLESFLRDVIECYQPWIQNWFEWGQVRNNSIRELKFPFAEYRAGQRDLAKAVYRAIIGEARLLAEAPTGIGKTISVLFPAIKALAEERIEKAFYLTGKTIVRTVAEKGIDDLRRAGLRLRSLTITARDKICFNDGKPCDVATCRYAIGYYDRYREALKQALEEEILNFAALERIARQRQVCPFALTLDAAPWVDLIICDYNYVFDPRAYLKQFFGEQKRPFVFLVDEAHNLPDRAREMFSAELRLDEVREARGFASELPRSGKLLRQIEKEFLGLGDEVTVLFEAPEALLRSLADLLDMIEECLVKNEPSMFRNSLLEFYFRVLAFVRTSELYNQRYRTLITREVNDVRIRLYCLDPSELLNLALDRGVCSVLFSATLTPRSFFQQIFGATRGLQLESPFPPENLKILVADQIATDFKRREQTAEQVSKAIGAFVGARAGNYIIYFPSYAYLKDVLKLFQELNPGVGVIVQESGMDEFAREKFMACFAADGREALVGFAVMGGIFGEGIDLIGDRLIGAVIVGVGLPQLCLERNLIRNYFDEAGVGGFEYAYTYPGFIRVLQAVGRVIRSPSDRGAVLLIDRRFREDRYRQLYPPYWAPESVGDAAEISDRLREFWTGS